MWLYVNLKDEMRRRTILQHDIAIILEINDIIAGNKINSKLSFTFKEAEILQSKLFPELEITYLFKIKKLSNPEQGRLESQK